MIHDVDLCAALRKCECCDSTGCSHCRLARIAADRIESKQRAFVSCYEDLCKIAERVRERCAKECEKAVEECEGLVGDYAKGYRNEALSRAAAIRALTVDDLLKT